MGGKVEAERWKGRRRVGAGKYDYLKRSRSEVGKGIKREIRGKAEGGDNKCINITGITNLQNVQVLKHRGVN
jgi:hypothetical protein